MAERLPRYRPLGASIGSVPTVNYAAAGAAKADVFGEMANAINRMTNFAIKEAEQRATIEGAEYGAENAPTAQQLKDAMAGGEDVAELMPGDKGTVFGRAARDAAIEAVSTNLEIAARQEILKFRSNPENRTMSPEEYSVKLNGIIQGYSETISSISKTAGVKFNAGMATVANSSYLAHLNQLTDIYDRQRSANARAGGDAIIGSISDIIVAGDRVATDGTQLRVVDLIAANRQSLLKMAPDMSEADFKQLLKDFDDAVDAELTGAFSDYTISNPQANFAEIVSGKISDPRLASIYSQLTPEQRREAIKQSNSALSDYYSRESAQDARDERIRKNNSANIQAELTQALITNDQDAVDDALGRMRPVDPEKWSRLTEAMASSPGVDNSVVVDSLRLDAINGVLKLDDVLTARRNGQISTTTFNSLLGSIDKQRNDQYTQAIRIVKSSVGLPDIPLINPSQEQRSAIQKVASIQVQLDAQLRIDPNTDVISWVTDKVDSISSAQQAELDAAQKQIDGLFDKYGITRGSFNDLRARLQRDGSLTDAQRQEYYQSINKVQGL